MTSRLAVLLAASLLCAANAYAQQLPMPTVIRLVVPFTPGGSTDAVARSVAVDLAKRLKTSVIVENRAGGGGLIGATAVAKGPTDGSMLLFSTASLVTSAATNTAVKFDVKKDLIPISILGEGPLVVAVSSKTSIKTPAELIAAAKAKPNSLTYGSSGVGTIAHLTAEMLNDDAKVQIRHIPYKGTSMALIDLVSGNIDMTVGIFNSLASQVQSGNIRLIGVTTKQPNTTFPGLPTMASVVPGFEATTWTAVFAPPGTSPALLDRFNKVFNEVAQSKEVSDQLRLDGNSIKPMTMAQSSKLVNDSFDTWKKIAVAKKIVAE